MIDIEKLKPQIIEPLKSLEPEKIILFGSYAYGTPNEENHIDLFLLKDDLNLNKLVAKEWLTKAWHHYLFINICNILNINPEELK
jgi:predicted nucleotidyltransferase